MIPGEIPNATNFTNSNSSNGGMFSATPGWAAENIPPARLVKFVDLWCFCL
jgi:hypothetical protein